MSRSIVGVDIGSAAVRAVEVEGAHTSRPTLVRYQEAALPAGAVHRGEIIEPRTVSTIIKRLWSSGGFRSKEVVLGMGNQRVLARDLTLPRMSQTRIRESLPYQVQDLLPVPVTEAMLDFYPISEEETANGPVIHGLLIAAIKEAVLGNVRAVEMAGLRVSAVDLIPFALARVLLRGEIGVGTVALMDMGATATTIVIATNGVPQFLRIVPAGGDDLTEVLSQRMEIDLVSADALKRGIGLRTRVDDPAHEVPMTIINEKATELIASARNTLKYFAEARPGSPISRIVLSGGGSQLRGTRDALAELTRIPVVAADPLSSLDVGRSVNIDELRGQQSSLLVALGLAMGSKS